MGYARVPLRAVFSYDQLLVLRKVKIHLGNEALSIRKKLAFCLIAVSVVIAADVGLAQIAKFGFDWFEEDVSAKEEPFRIPSDIYHHGFSANTTGTATWGDKVIPFFSNSLAFRNSEVREVPLRPEGARVLILGDAVGVASGCALMM